MPIGLSEFWTRLVGEGLLDAAGCRAVAMEYAKAHENQPPRSADQLAGFLVESDRVTLLQARCLLADPPGDLRLGSYRIRVEQGPAPFGRWVEVEPITVAMDDSVDGLTIMLRTSAENPWLDAHSKINHPSLQPIAIEPVKPYVGVVSKLPPGDLLARSPIFPSPMAPRRVCEIGVSICRAIGALHAGSMPSGSVRADRIWLGEDGSAVLLRDPAGPPTTGTGDTTGQWLATNAAIDDPVGYVAPELIGRAASGLAVTIACTGASDVYSLGCLLYRLRTGRAVATSLQSHLQDTPPEIAKALSDGESGDPLFRVLAYALAKDPANRFPAAEQLAAALQAIETTYPAAQKSPTPTPTLNPSPTPSKRVPSPVVAPTKPSRKPSLVAELQKPTGTSPEGSRPTAKVQAEAKPNRPARDAAKAAAQPVAAQLATEQSVVENATPEVPPAPKRQRRRRKRRIAPYVLTGLTVIVLALFVALLVTDPTAEPVAKRTLPPLPAVIPPVANPARATVEPIETLQKQDDSPRTDSPRTDSTGYDLVDDQRLLFAPSYPAASDDVSLSMLPPGPAAILSLRFDSIRQSRASEGLLQTLPELADAMESLASRGGVPVDAVRRCTLALFPGSGGTPTVALAFELNEPQPLDSWSERLSVSAAQTRDGETIYAGDATGADAAYVMPDDVASKSIRRFAIGSLDRISEVAAMQGGAIPLPRMLQQLWNASSDDAGLVAMTTPNFLFADGRGVLEQTFPELMPAIKSVLIPDAAGVLLIADTSNTDSAADGSVFVEVRLSPSGGISEASLMRQTRDAVTSWPDWADQFIVDAVPDSSWRLLASRLPTMTRFVVDQFRFGVSDGAVVANTYLPAPAVSQWTLATLLAANTPRGVAVAGTDSDAQPLTINEMLERKMSVSFDQESLEFAIDAIVGEFTRALPPNSQMPPVRIVGSDLQKMGITQNQQVRNFAKTDLPLRTVLTDLMLGANPDRTATGPDDPKQALIWVLAVDPEDPNQQEILVTTREAAKDRYELPTEFQPKN